MVLTETSFQFTFHGRICAQVTNIIKVEHTYCFFKLKVSELWYMNIKEDTKYFSRTDRVGTEYNKNYYVNFFIFPDVNITSAQIHEGLICDKLKYVIFSLQSAVSMFQEKKEICSSNSAWIILTPNKRSLTSTQHVQYFTF